MRIGVDELDDPLAEDRARPRRVGAGELLDQEAGHEQDFEPVAKSIGEKAHDSEPPVKEICRLESERESERRVDAALVAETSAAPRAFAEGFGVSEQRLHGDRRSRALGHDFERQHAFLVAERHERDRQALVIGQDGLFGAARLCRRDPGLIRRKRARQGRGRNFMLAPGRANGLGDLRVGERQNPVAQRLVDRRQAIETAEGG